MPMRRRDAWVGVTKPCLDPPDVVHYGLGLVELGLRMLVNQPPNHMDMS